MLAEFLCESLKNVKLPLKHIMVFTGYFLISLGYLVAVSVSFQVFNFCKIPFFFFFLKVASESMECQKNEVPSISL